MRQRTTPWMAGIGPLSTMAASASRCPAVSLEGWPGALPLISPSGPLRWSLDFGQVVKLGSPFW